MKTSSSKILAIALPLVFGVTTLSAQIQLECFAYANPYDCNQDSECQWFSYGCQGGFIHECFDKSEQECTGECWWQDQQTGICDGKGSQSTKTDRK